MDDLLGSAQEALASAKEAAEATKKAEDQVRNLQAECARKDRIILEKVAAIKTASADKVDNLIDTLVEQGQVKAADAKIIKEQLLEHPDHIVMLAQKLATISMPAPAQGVGIAKEASVPKHSDPDSGWGNVIRNGA